MKKFFILVCFICGANGVGMCAPSIYYKLSFDEPQSHFVKVEMEVSNWPGTTLEVKMPVWTPGSYLIREYSRFVERISAVDGAHNILSCVKDTKNGWKINSNKAEKIKIVYFVYAFELSVRTSFIDDEHAYLNGASIFLFIDKMLQIPSVVEVIPYHKWSKISTSLERLNPDSPWILRAIDYDQLIDAPMEIGNHVVLRFIAAGIPHEIAFFGKANYDSLQVIRDIIKIVEAEKSIFGDHPCKRYVFIIHNIPNGSGGLEHMNSSTLQVARNGYSPGGLYNSFLSLVAHEYFHLWNVKRLRPQPLGPFDYDKENYSTLLYVAEGFTAYYDDLITRRCGFIDDNLYLATVAGYVTSLENTPGSFLQSVSESGFDAWIKYYRPSENNLNSTVSYYTKGALIGCLLDLFILNATNGVKRLDDVMKSMYDEYYKKLNRCYTENEFSEMVAKISGKDMNYFFGHYINKADSIPYPDYFKLAGLELTNDNFGNSIPYLGVNTNTINGKISITFVERNSPAWKDGLNVNDEIIAVDNARISEDFVKFISTKKPGDQLNFEISRSGLIKNVLVKLVQSKKVSYKLVNTSNSNEKQKFIYNKWISN